MKKKIMLLAILLLVFAGIIGFRFFMYDSQNSFGILQVATAPTAQVFIDNNLVSKTPYEGKLKAGDYLVKLIPDGSAGQTATSEFKVTVYQNARTYVNRELGDSDITTAGEVFTLTKMEKEPKEADFGEIYVETDPSGAIVSLDNNEMGVAPLILEDVMKGNHELSVLMPGMYRRTAKINVNAGYRVNTTFKLAMDPTQQRTTPTPDASGSALLDDTKKTSTPSASPKKTQGGATKVIIKDTPTGFLRVRADASVAASESAQVKPGESFELIEEKNGWYMIEYESDKTGWISGQYAEKE